MEKIKSEPPQTSKKVGADGLSKKERRALRVDAQSKNSESNPAKVKLAVPLKTSTEKIPKQPAPVNPSQATVSVDSNKPDSKDNSGGKEPSKAELKAQRRSHQEAQRLAKANVKTIAEDTGNKTGERVSKENESKISEKATENGEVPNKAELKAKRRLIQEAQRLAKEAAKGTPIVKLPKEASPPTQTIEKKPILRRISKKSVFEHRVQLFNHLYFKNSNINKLEDGTINISGVHSSFLRLGVQYASNTVLGSNARCLALLSALKTLIRDFTTPPKHEFCRSLETTLQNCVTYLQNCRPLAVSMTNALRYFKLHLTQVETNISDDEKRYLLLERVESYIGDEINKAGEAISMQVQGKIINDDVILTYGCSSLVTKILLDAYKNGRKFKVIVVDARPLLEGKEMLRKLVTAGIQCTYVLINAASFIMSRATKVLLGAHALLANGYVMSRTGTAQVALIARAYNKPVLVCCETYKFCERAQTDSFVYNEIGDEDKLVSVDTSEESSSLVNWRSSNYLIPLNLMYDVTPPDLVTVVVTELAFLPCTSVPVILRIRPSETLLV